MKVSSCLVLFNFSLLIFGCPALSSINRQKRRQRGLARTRKADTPLVTLTPVDDGNGSSFEQEENRELLWNLAGQSSRRKRQRGRKVAVELREDFLGPKNDILRPTEKKEILDIIQPHDIERVEVIRPSVHGKDPILASVLLKNGTLLSDIDPQKLHQRDDNAIWMALRASLDVTASEMSAVVGNSVFTTREKLAQKKAGLMSTKFTGNKQACDWGLKMEPKAFRQYLEVSGNNVTETGLHIRELTMEDGFTRLVGASPDGLVVDSKDGSKGLLEIKCLWGRRKDKQLSPFDHCPKRFFDQIQGQLAVCDLDFCDLMIYIPPNNRRYKNYCILRVSRDETYWEETLLPGIQSFTSEVENLKQNIQTGFTDELSV